MALTWLKFRFPLQVYTEADCQELVETVNRYFEMFQCMTAEQTPAYCAGALADHVID